MVRITLKQSDDPQVQTKFRLELINDPKNKSMFFFDLSHEDMKELHEELHKFDRLNLSVREEASTESKEPC